MPSRSNPLVKRVHQKYRGHCAYCGCMIKLADTSIDHIRPKSRGGRNAFANYNPSCIPCNRYKGSHSLESWRRMAQKQVVPHLSLIDEHYFYFEKHRAHKA